MKKLQLHNPQDYGFKRSLSPEDLCPQFLLHERTINIIFCAENTNLSFLKWKRDLIDPPRIL